MFGRKQPQILVAGAGPVGLFSALLLARRGVRVRIVDREWQTTSRSYALALHPRSLALLEEVGLLGHVLDAARRVRTVSLYDGRRRRAEAAVGDAGEDFPFLAVLRQDVLEGLLEEALAAEGVHVAWNHQVRTLRQHEDHVTATVARLDKESMGYSVAHTEWVVSRTRDRDVLYVLGADGHDSFVRRALHIPFERTGPPQHFAVFEFATDADLGDEMRLTLRDDTVDVLWPLPDGRCRWSFELTDVSAPETSRTKDRLSVEMGTQRFPLLDEAYLHALIAERAPWFQGEIGGIDWRILVRFEQRLAAAFGAGRAWLAGDAAHMTGPAGIQSMNAGLVEARRLADVLADAVLHGAPRHRLDEYDRARRSEWRALLGLSAHLEPDDATDPWLAAQTGRLLPCLPATGPDLAPLAARLGLRLHGAPVTEADAAAPAGTSS